MSELTTEKNMQNGIRKDSDSVGVGGDSEDRVIGSLPDGDGQLDGWMSVAGS
jgi:hypothetical protein